MSAVLEFPTIADPVASSTAVAKIDLKALALSRFGDWKPDAEKVVAKYKGVIFDAATPKGYKALTEAIAEVRAPRYAAQNVSKNSKSELAAVSKAVGAEEAAVAAFLDATEKELVAQKDAEDARREEEAERVRVAAAERVAGFNSRIQAIRDCVGKCKGLPSERIAAGIAKVESFAFPADEWAEFAVPAANAQCETLEVMRGLFTAAKTAEDAAAAQEAQRVEQARVAQEQAETQRRLDEARELIAKAEREAAAQIEAERKKLAEERAAWLAEQEAAKPKPAQETHPVELTEVRPRDEGMAPEACESATGRGDNVAPALAIAPNAQAPAESAQVGGKDVLGCHAEERPPSATGTLNAGHLCKRLGFVLTVDFITNELGVPPTTTDRRATLWTETQFRAICEKLRMHIAAVAEQTEAVPA